MIELSGKWADCLRNQPETGMGYTVCDVELSDGRITHRVVVVGGTITKCDGSPTIPFFESDIVRISATHDKLALKNSN